MQILYNSNNFQGKSTSEEKSGPTKKHKFHETSELFCSQWQNIESKGAWEVETLQVPNQLFPQSVCQKSSKANIFEGKRASEAKSGEAKKHKFDESLDLLQLYSKNLESREL